MGVTTWEEVFKEEDTSRLQSANDITIQVNGDEREAHNVMTTPAEFERIQERLDEMRSHIPSIAGTVECSITVGGTNND